MNFKHFFKLAIVLVLFSSIFGCSSSGGNPPPRLFSFCGHSIQGEFKSLVVVVGTREGEEISGLKTCNYSDTRLAISLVGEEAENFLANVQNYTDTSCWVEENSILFRGSDGNEEINLEIFLSTDYVEGSILEKFIASTETRVIFNNNFLMNKMYSGILNGCELDTSSDEETSNDEETSDEATEFQTECFAALRAQKAETETSETEEEKPTVGQVCINGHKNATLYIDYYVAFPNEKPVEETLSGKENVESIIGKGETPDFSLMTKVLDTALKSDSGAKLTFKKYASSIEGELVSTTEIEIIYFYKIYFKVEE